MPTRATRPDSSLMAAAPASWKRPACPLAFFRMPYTAHLGVLVPGAILLIVSRGVIEVTHEGEEFGLEGVNGVLQGLRAKLPCAAPEVCTTTLRSAQAFMRGSTIEDDLTTLCLVRSSLVRNSNPAV
jgi:hypothetical protein